ncbi:MAG: hypothetical protein VX265_09850 [Myxococcota bacterium]|nr:hypothetical protein [Myxococcota bacterium]
MKPVPLMLLVAACGTPAPSGMPAGDSAGAGTGGAAGDDTAAPEEDCTGVPALSWSAWGDGFFATYCRSCHAVSAPDRHGAPAGVDFDTEADVDGWRSRVRARTLELGTMPLGGGVPLADLDALDAYLRCGIGSAGGARVPEVDEEPLEAAWDAAGLRVALDAALGDGLPQVHDIRRVYLGFFEYGDPICPGHADYIDDLWLYGCYSDSMVFFSGVSEYVSDAAPLAEPATRSYSVFGDLLFVDRQQRAFDGGGDIWSEVEVAANGDAERWTRHLGTWAYAGDSGLLDQGVSGVLDQWHSREAGEDRLIVDGSVQFRGSSLRFDNLELGLGGACEGKASGAIALRAPGGGWYRIELGDTCAACGQAVFEGREAIGEVCPDFTAMTEQGVRELTGIVSGALP